MFHHDLKLNGRLAIFQYSHLNQVVVTATGYLIKNGADRDLYIVSLHEEPTEPLRCYRHLALARFAKEMGASHLVPVPQAFALAARPPAKGCLNGGFLPTKAAVTLTQLEALLGQEHVVAANALDK